MSITAATAAFFEAVNAWAEGELYRSIGFCQAALETLDHLPSETADEEAARVRMQVAHFVIDAWTPSATRIAMRMPNTVTRSETLRGIRHAFLSSAEWFEGQVRRGMIRETASGAAVGIDEVLARSAKQLAEINRALGAGLN